MQAGPQSPPTLSPTPRSRSRSPPLHSSLSSSSVQRWRDPSHPSGRERDRLTQRNSETHRESLALRPSGRVSPGRRSPSPRSLGVGEGHIEAEREQGQSISPSVKGYRLGDSVRDREGETEREREWSRALVGVREEWLALREDLTLAGQREGAPV